MDNWDIDDDIVYFGLLAAQPAPRESSSVLWLTLIVCIAGCWLLTHQQPQPVVAVEVVQPLQEDVAPPETHEGSVVLKGAPSGTEADIEAILTRYQSPAVGTGNLWIKAGKEYGINPMIALAFFIMESSAGTASGWAGWKADGTHTHNIGNIICAGRSPFWQGACHGRFRDYPDWRSGIYDWFHLIETEYIQGRGHRTVTDVIPVYAPAFENDVQGYKSFVDCAVMAWASGKEESVCW
jgi:hypothetical protein